MYYFRLFLFLLITHSSATHAGAFVSLAANQISVDASVASSKMLGADFRLGYALDAHQLELAVMGSVKEDEINQLTIETPSVTSLLYRYAPYQESRLKVHLILGVSQVDVETTINAVTTTDSFDGVSYGLGLEEAFISVPNLSFKLDWLRLYRGDQVEVDVLSLGLSYEF